MTILWDWNGTLLDDVDLGIFCEEIALPRFHYPPFTREEYLQYFDFPVKDFYLRHGVREEDYMPVAKCWNEAYLENFSMASLREDAMETLKRFEKAGFLQAIISASHQEALEKQVASFSGLKEHLQAVQGISSTVATSKIEEAKILMQHLRAVPSETVLLGDSNHDLETANTLGCRCCLIAGGHQAKSRLLDLGAPVFDTLTDACNAILSEVHNV